MPPCSLHDDRHGAVHFLIQNGWVPNAMAVWVTAVKFRGCGVNVRKTYKVGNLNYVAWTKEKQAENKET